MLGYVYGTDQGLNANQDLGLKVATPIGTLIGQLLFGRLADVVGGRRMYGVELIIIITATFSQALAGQGPAVNVIGVLVLWRFILGLGVGGDYPSSAVISSEFASTRIRGRMMTAVFAFQGWGNFFAAFVGFIIVASYKTTLLSDDPNHPNQLRSHVDTMWRLLIGLGCIPGVIALYFRLTIPETPRFTMDIEKNIHQVKPDSGDDGVVHRAHAPRATWADFWAYFSKSKNFKVLLGTSYSWFALDVAFYGLNLNSSIIFQAINFATPVSISEGPRSMIPLDVYNDLYNISVGNLILSAGGLIPGYWACFLFIESRGRKPIQYMGFIALTILFVIMGFAYDKLTETTAMQKVFVLLYCFANFFANFGPNTTTFIIPGEAFPTPYRSTAHGISAASGKLGAIVAQVGFDKLKDIGGPPHGHAFVKHILKIFALFMLTGIASTTLVPETMNKSLEELSNEKQDHFLQGEPVGHRTFLHLFHHILAEQDALGSRPRDSSSNVVTQEQTLNSVH
ncbi:hypothetical protein HGRIS_010287 [Hohenbuehelia grisea]|uniref:Major facilitator superfamily (MFS) profile domain-containing protein n=1 Tax=Hohenbuehelia grisea TaxID=104357 RepID=A0ABR3J485_9AGAR